MTLPNGQRKPTLLVVDDDEGPRQALKIIFKDEYEVMTADNGSDALKLAQAHRVNAAILDIRMPGMSGLELLGRLKKISPETGVIILTGYESVETARQALRLGACDYFAKPFDLMAMRSAVASAVERHRNALQVQAIHEAACDLQTQVRNYQIQVETALQQGSLYASILHDLNTPLSSLSLSISLIQTDLDTANALEAAQLAGLRDQIKALHRQVNKCQDITHRYLQILSARERGERSTDLNLVLSDLERLLRKHKGLEHAKLVISGFDHNTHVQANSTDLAQILINLASNALETDPPPSRVTIGGELVTDPFAAGAFALRPGILILNPEAIAGKSPLVVIKVRDDGPGIPPEDLNRIFQAYYTTKSAKGGCGLGLSIVERLLRYSEGCLRVESHPGQGTEFSLYFALCPPGPTVAK